MRIKSSIYLVVILMLVLGCVISTSSKAASKYAAKVNGTGIENATLDVYVNDHIENQKRMGIDIKEEDRNRLRKDILERAVSFELLYQESKKVSLGDLNEEIDRQFEDIKKGFASEEDFKKNLKQINKTEKDLKGEVKKRVYVQAFLNRDIFSKITVTETEKKQEYERNKDKLRVPERIRASHILIRVKSDVSEEDKKNARKKIEELRRRALSGEDFAELAKGNSEDGSAPNGGDLNYFKKGDLVKPFEDVAFSLGDGEISKVVETQFGYHIIKLVDRSPAHTRTYSEVEHDIENFLLNQHREEALAKFIDDLRKSAKIEYID